MCNQDKWQGTFPRTAWTAPVAELVVGTQVTVLVQSSSTSTAVGMWTKM